MRVARTLDIRFQLCLAGAIWGELKKRKFMQARTGPFVSLGIEGDGNALRSSPKSSQYHRAESKIDLAELFGYVRDTQDAVFLFDQEVADYLSELYRKAVDLQTTQAKYDPLPAGEGENSAVQQREWREIRRIEHAGR